MILTAFLILSQWTFAADWPIRPVDQSILTQYFDARLADARQLTAGLQAIGGPPARDWPATVDVRLIAGRFGDRDSMYFPLGPCVCKGPELWVNWQRELSPDDPLFGRVVRDALIRVLVGDDKALSNTKGDPFVLALRAWWMRLYHPAPVLH